MKRLFIFSSIILFAALFVTACGVSSPGSPAAPTPLPPTPTMPPSKPTTISQEPTVAISPTPKMPSVTPTPTVSPLPTVTLSPAAAALVGAYDRSKGLGGPETLLLADSYHFAFQFHAEHETITGTWAIAAGQITFTEAGENGDCPGKPGTYKFVMDGKVLTLTVVNDSMCGARQEDIALGPYMRRP